MVDRSAADLSVASARPRRFDVFLSYNGRDRATVERIAEWLKQAGLEPWFDTWSLTPGGRWQDEIVVGLDASSACAVFIGPDDLGDWEREELALAQIRAAADRDFRLFPVLLAGLGDPFEPGVLPPFLSTRTWVDLRRGHDDRRSLQSLVNAVKGIPLGPELPIEADSQACPYRGLQTFDEEHAEYFFGRDGDVQRLLEKLKASRFLAVVGASGAGKSSVVRAGLVPAVRRGMLPGGEVWTIRVFTPGAHPLAVLAAQLLRLYPSGPMQATLAELATDERTLNLAVALADRPRNERILWVVDQAEEVFTLCRDEQERVAFFRNLLYAALVPHGQSSVVLTLRADFYPRAAAYPELSQQLASHQYLVGALDAEGLRQAVEEPARLVGLELESGLAATILDDVGDEPGTLPLLEYALLELWERRRGRMLTLEGYRESGGVARAIATRAEEIFLSFTPEQQTIARQAFLRLTQPGEGTEDTRRRASLEELTSSRGASGELESVLGVLVEARMLTTGGDEQAHERWVGVSHEALIRAWPRLRGWVEQDRAGLLVHRRITEAAEEWQRLERDPDSLFRGARLAEAREWRASNEGALNDLEREFLNASRELDERDRRAAEERRQRELEQARQMAEAETRARKRLRWIAVTLLVALAVSISGVVVALDLRSTAIGESRLSQSRELAAKAIAQLDNDPERALFSALRAADVRRTPEAEDALRRTLGASHLRAALAGATPSLSPDGKLLATVDTGGTITLWRIADAQPVGKLRGHSGYIWNTSFSPNGRLLVSAGSDRTVRIWDVKRQRQIVRLATRQHQQLAGFSPNGRLVATTYPDQGVDVWTTSGKRLARLPHAGYVFSPTFAMNGQALVTELGDDDSQVWDTVTRSVVATLDGPLLAVDSAGRHIVTRTAHGAVVWSAPHWRQTATLQGHRVAPRNECDGCFAVENAAFSSDGALIATAGSDGTARIWDAATGRETGKVKPIASRLGSSDTITAAKLSPDGRLLVTAGFDAAQIWDRASGSPIAILGQTASNVSISTVFSPSGDLLVTSAGGPSAQVWASETGEHVTTLRQRGFRTQFFGGSLEVLISSDGEHIVTAQSDCSRCETLVWDVPRIVLRHPDAHSAVFSRNGRLIATAGEDNVARIWDAATGKRLAILRGHTALKGCEGSCSDVRSVVFDAAAKRVVTAGMDGTARVWQAPTGKPLALLRGAGQPLTRATFLRDGRRVVGADEAGVAYVWDARSGRELRILRPPPGNASRGRSKADFGSVVLSTDGRIAAASRDNRTRIWDTTSGRRLESLDGDAVAINANGTVVVAVNARRRARVIRTATGKTIAFLPGTADEFTDASISADGRLVAGSTEEGVTQVWDAASGRVLATTRDHAGPVTDIAFSRDSRLLATTGEDDTVRVSNALTGEAVATFAGYQGGVSVEFSPDARRLVTTAPDGTARVIPCEQCAGYDALVRLACNRFRADFLPDERETLLAGRNLRICHIRK